MAIINLKSIKVKNKRKVTSGSRDGACKPVGFSKAESRGIFGSGYVPNEEEAERIRDYERRKLKKARKKGGKRPCEYYEPKRKSNAPHKNDAVKNIQAGEVPDELEARCDALRKLGVNVVGFKTDDGTVTFL